MKVLCAFLLAVSPALVTGEAKVGAACASFRLPNRHGRLVAWKPGRVTVLSVYAMWCDTWKVQLPRLTQARECCAGLPVDFLIVSVDGRWPELAPSGVALLLDRNAAWSRPLGIDRVPTTLVLDSSGVIRFSRSGVLRSDELTRTIRSISTG